MPKRICYLGDDDLATAAAYLAGIMTHAGLPYEHVPSSESPSEKLLAEPFAAYVLSDYPAARWQKGQLDRVIDRVREGAGLVMMGGWSSYYGRLGEYHQSPLAEVLPVEMLAADDRRNSAQPCLVEKTAEHEILAGLPWETPPGIGGFNAFLAKPGGREILAARLFSVRRTGERYEFNPAGQAPLLVVGEYGKGRTAALATDVAPHWVGGMVDWGDRRVFQEVRNGGFVEIGNWYAKFFEQLLRWVGRLETID